MKDRKFQFELSEAEANALWRAIRKREAEQYEKLTNALREFQNVAVYIRNQHMRLPAHLVSFLRSRWNECGVDLDWLEENPTDFITPQEMFVEKEEATSGS